MIWIPVKLKLLCKKNATGPTEGTCWFECLAFRDISDLHAEKVLESDNPRYVGSISPFELNFGQVRDSIKASEHCIERIRFDCITGRFDDQLHCIGDHCIQCGVNVLGSLLAEFHVIAASCIIPQFHIPLATFSVNKNGRIVGTGLLPEGNAVFRHTITNNNNTVLRVMASRPLKWPLTELVVQ